MPRLIVCKAAAASNGGRCLSQAYRNATTPMDWECGECGHVWAACLRSVRNLGSWCPKCSGNLRLCLEDAQRAAAARGGECLAETYENCATPLLWRCGRDGTEWRASLNHVKSRGSWCPTCAGNAQLSLADAEAIAEMRGGRCRSSSYSNSGLPLEWQCGDCDGVWSASLASVKRCSSWCPYCRNKNEGAVRALFERLTGHAFPHVSGLFAVNRRWQLDGYCRTLGIAFEYNGRQHYEYMPHFHRNGRTDLEKQQLRDAIVEREAPFLEEPVYLIVVPYWLSAEEREDMIRRELSSLGVLAGPAQ